VTVSPATLRVAMIGLRGLPASWGGVERHVEEIGARLADRGHDVTVFCRPDYAEAGLTTYKGMHLVEEGTVRSRGAEALVHSVRSSLRTLGSAFQVVHFHAVGPGLAAPLPRYLSRAAVVQTIHGLDGARDKWGGPAQALLRAGTWMSARVPHRTVTVSRSLQQHYEQTYGRRPSYVQNGVVRGERGSEQVLRERFGLTPGGYLLYVGRLVPEKAADLLLEAFAAIRTDLRLVLAGGSSHTDDFAARVSELAARDPRVLMPGYVFGPDLAALYEFAHTFVLPSRLEGLPLTLLEAASYELPLVLSSIPPHLEVVKAQGPGVQLAEPGSVQDLRAALERALVNQVAERAGARERSRTVLEHYDWDLATDLLEQVYADAVHDAARRRPVAWSGFGSGPKSIVRPARPTVDIAGPRSPEPERTLDLRTLDARALDVRTEAEAAADTSVPSQAAGSRGGELGDRAPSDA